MNTLMKNKRGLVMGVANERSIAWGIAKVLHEAGAELAFSYTGENLKRRVEPLAEKVNSDKIYECNVTEDASIEAMFADLEKTWGKLDFVVHAIAFSDKDELKGRFIDTTRENFKNTMDISAYSLPVVAKYAEPMLTEHASIIALSYYGAEKVVANYNVMGVAKAALEASVRYLAADMGPQGTRVNAISAGPIRTLASSAIGGFKTILATNEKIAPLRQNVTTEEVGKTALWLLSDLSSGVTGETVYVDGGANIMGVALPE
jgi:enoyl-[acyl-carrier protein] reductase I